jgi:hypothetical protein
MAEIVVIDVQTNALAANKEIEKLTDSVEDLAQSTKEVTQETSKASTGFEDVTKNGGAIAILDQLTGGLASRVRDSYEATKLFNFSLKGMRTALIATGVGAFVVALGLVVAYWDDIKDAISGATKNLQRFIDNQENLIKQLNAELVILEKQKELANLRGESIGKINDEIIKTLKLEKVNNNLLLDRLETQLEVEKSKKRELTFGEKLRLQASKALGLGYAAQKQAEIYNDKYAKRSELEDKILELKTRNYDIEIKTTTVAEESLGRTKRNIETVSELAMESEIAVNDTILQSNQLAADSFEVKKQFTKEDYENTVLTEEAKLNMTKSTLGNISAALGEGTKAGKAAAAAAALINTYQGITAELATKTVTPFEFAIKLANIATTAAIGFKSVKDILKTTPKNATSSASNPSRGATAPAQSPAFNIVGQGGASQIATALGEQQQQPVQAYVVSQDVTTAQSLENGIIQGATIGG